MKKFRRIAIFVTVACLALGLMLFAGCDNEVTLTLDAGNGGTLSADSLQVKSGAKLSDVLKNVTVTADSGLTFAGWFNGEQQRRHAQGGLDVDRKIRRRLHGKRLLQ